MYKLKLVKSFTLLFLDTNCNHFPQFTIIFDLIDSSTIECNFQVTVYDSSWYFNTSRVFLQFEKCIFECICRDIVRRLKGMFYEANNIIYSQQLIKRLWKLSCHIWSKRSEYLCLYLEI